MEQWTKQARERPRVTNVNDKDIIVSRAIKVTEYTEEGFEIRKTLYSKENITKKVNETAKLLKQETINEKANKIAEILKGENEQ